uniref:Uncharacterized protein n=1 Tax=Yersinia enterocolitica TaxID=630 RepID=B0RL14_YEREN|nr:hypothetical protein [Yersinia enterocolitica]
MRKSSLSCRDPLIIYRLQIYECFTRFPPHHFDFLCMHKIKSHFIIVVFSRNIFF